MPLGPCHQCTAFVQTNPKGGVCRANPPQLLVFGMEQVNIPGLKGGMKGQRPLTGTGFPEVPLDGGCRDGFKPIPKAESGFDVSKLKPQGEVAGLNGFELSKD